MSYESLSEKAKMTYAEVNRRFGFENSYCTHAPLADIARRDKNEVVYSGDPLTSDIPPKIVLVANIDQMNELVGIPNGDDDSHVQYPDPIKKAIIDKLSEATSRDNLISILSPEERANIKIAADAFIMGDSAKVSAYEGIINALYFPQEIAYFASDEPHIIDTKVVLKGPTPVKWNYPSIIMKDGGSIVQEGGVPMSVTTSAMTSEKSSGDFPINSVPADPVPLTAPAGNPGPKGDPSHTQGTQGVNSYNSSNCTYSCKTQPGRGGTGGTGKNGKKGTDGIVGTAMSGPNSWHAGDITGKLIIVARGGNGQNGGKGGDGGAGGDGGPGGAQAPHGKCSAPGPTGYTGVGGNGAVGGNGGDGGPGSTITIYYSSIEGGIDLDGVVQSQPGEPGTGGLEGKGEAGNGSPGDNGQNGSRGSKPIINPIKQ